MEDTIINTIIEKKMKQLLEMINKNYPSKFKTENIDKELEYIIKHVNIVVKHNDTTIEIESIEKKSTNNKPHTNKQTIKTLTIPQENRCCGRCWNDNIIDRETMVKIKDIDTIFKVIDFKDINIKKFNKKYIIGRQCGRKKIQNTDYCKLHSHHLIHGNFNDIPSKEICYHFMKDGKYL
jgi:hypothetical protein